MKRVVKIVSILMFAVFFVACSSGSSDMKGNRYNLSMLDLTDGKYKKITISSYEDLNNAIDHDYSKTYVILDEELTKMEYHNSKGTYKANMACKVDDDMWQVCSVQWEDTPNVFEGHKITGNYFIIREDIGLIRMNFGIDGEDNDYTDTRAISDCKYIIFTEFEKETQSR